MLTRRVIWVELIRRNDFKQDEHEGQTWIFGSFFLFMIFHDCFYGQDFKALIWFGFFDHVLYTILYLTDFHTIDKMNFDWAQAFRLNLKACNNNCNQLLVHCNQRKHRLIYPSIMLDWSKPVEKPFDWEIGCLIWRFKVGILFWALSPAFELHFLGAVVGYSTISTPHEVWMIDLSLLSHHFRREGSLF